MDDKKKPQPETEKRSPPQQPQPNERRGEPNEGEGNKTADRHYREHFQEFEEQHDIESLGRAARRDIERDPEGYRAAEDEGKRRMAEEDRELYRKAEDKKE